ncbi:hypothetical protein [Streptomyces sp. NPDC049555]|uniref:hypothetical protein n=1 Tax=Streptomyces sp. NPDC049555 TaxID=3154930 RepID=UPI0034341ECF
MRALAELNAPSAVVADSGTWADGATADGPFVPDQPPTVTLTTADRKEFLLTASLSQAGACIAILPGPTGMDAPPWQASVSEYAGLDGGQVVKTRAATRRINLPLLLWAPTRPELLSLRRRLITAVMAGPGTLRVAEADGSARTIGVHYLGGLEGDEGSDNTGLTYARYGLQLVAPDPYWSGPVRTATFRVHGGTPHFLSRLPAPDPAAGGDGSEVAFFPLRIGASVIGERGVPITVTSDTDAWPVWRITGPLGAQDAGQPAVPLRLSNTTTGKSMALNYAVPAGETVVIDTRPGIKAVYRETPDGGQAENLWPHVTGGAALWPLVPGTNTVSVTAAGADDRSAVTLTYQPRHYGA